MLLILLAAKFAINYLYEEGYFSWEKIKYDISVSEIEKLSDDEFKEVIEETAFGKTVLIYMGRYTCPTCVELLLDIKAMFEANRTLDNGEAVEQYYFDSDEYQTERIRVLRESIEANSVPSIIVVHKNNISVLDAEAILKETFVTDVNQMINS